MSSLTVESADDLLANSRLLSGISSCHHAFRQTGQLISRQLTLSVELVRKSDHAQLLLRIEPFNFFNDLSRGHTEIVTRPSDSSNERYAISSLITHHSSLRDSLLHSYFILVISIIRSALEINPFLTISALAERIVENIVASLTH
jgi:hypothetical protein